ncbi:ribonuclease H-like domain, reverse transcriptase, RNA-dependent DNA polymerase [Tanacetum coccineum]
MTRSSRKELFTPFKNPEREFRSSRKLFKTLSLDESSSPEFDLFSDLEKHSEEEVAETMAETMEEYIGSDHEDANEHIEKVLEIVDLFHYCPPARTAKKIEEINNFQQEPDETLYQAWERFKELLMKCPQHYLTEMQEPSKRWLNILKKWHNKTSRTRSTETSDGLAAIQAQLNNLRREIKKVNEKVYATQAGCELCKGPHYTKDCLLKEEGKTLEEAYYTQFGVPFQQGGQYRAAASGFYQRNNANPSYQERRQSMEESLSKFMNESAKRHEENSNLIKETRAFIDTAIRNQGASIKALEIQIRKMSKVLQEKGSGSLPSSIETNPRDHVKSISTTVEADTTPICRIGSTQYACDDKKGPCGLKCLDAYSNRTTLLDDSLPKKEKDPGSLTLPCYINNVCFEKAITDLEASISVMRLSTYLNLGLGELAHTKLTVELADITVKHPKGIDENVLVGIGKFVFPIDFIILDIPEDVNVPLILRRPFLSTAHAKVDAFKRKITLRVGDEKIIFNSVKSASSLIKRVYMLSLRERMDLDLEARLMGETLILNRSLDPLYGDYIELNDLNEPLELRRNRVDDLEPIIEECEVVNKPMIDIVKARSDFIGGLDDYPSEFVEDMGPYLDEGIEDVIVGEPFCKASCVEARRFDGIITIRDRDDSVIYQMVWSNLRFKHLTNEKCNKIPPLLKVSPYGVSRFLDTTYWFPEQFVLIFYINRRIPEMGLHGFLIFCTGPRWKEIDNVGEVSIIWNPILIMEYFVKTSKKARILELKRRNLKNSILTSNTPYPSRKIRRIRACTSQETTKNKVQYALSRRP